MSAARPNSSTPASPDPPRRPTPAERSTPERPPSARRRRTWLVVAAALTVAVGLGARLGLRGVDGAAAWTGPLGDALYAVLIYLLLAFAAPRARSPAVAVAAFALCAAIELFQLTGVPAALGERLPLSRLILGTGFTATDLLLYLAGALGAGLVDAALRRRRARRPSGSSSRGSSRG